MCICFIFFDFFSFSHCSNDCGIFSVMFFFERWDVTIDVRRAFDLSDIENIRVKLANSLFFSPTNLVDKALVNFFYEQVFIGYLLSLINFFLLLCVFLLIIFFCFCFMQDLDPRLFK
jgi:hypothetical protein